MTTSLSDAQQIDNLLTDTTYDTIKFNSADWGWISDINNQAYQDRIIFSTTVLKQQLVDYNSAFVTIPITFTRAQLPAANHNSQGATGVAGSNFTTPYDYVSSQAAPNADPGSLGTYLRGDIYNEPLLAFRDSILNLICGMIVQTDNGQAIVNEYGRLDFINNLRLKIENSIDWAKTMGSLLHFDLDTVANSFYNGVPQPYNVSNGTDANTSSFGPGALANNFVNNGVNQFLPDANMQSGIYSTWPNTTDTTGTMAARPFPGPASSGAGIYPGSGNFATNTVTNMTNTILDTGTITVASAGATTSTVTSSGTPFLAAMVGGTLWIGTSSFLITAYTSSSVLVIGTGGVSFPALTLYQIVYSLQNSAAGLTNFTPVAVPNPGCNQGLRNRIQFFQLASVYTANSGTGAGSTGGQFTIVAKIPLRFLHDFWEQLDFPVINLGFNIQLILRQNHNGGGPTNPSSINPYQNIPPVQSAQLYGPNGTGTPYALWTTGVPAMQYGVNTGTYGPGCRLYYRSLKLNPAENQAFTNKLMKGFTKRIKFISTDPYQPQTAIYSKTPNSFVVAPSIVWPLRVWILLYSNGTASNTTNNLQTGSLVGNWGNGAPSATNIGQAAQTGLQVTHGWLTNCNISVNNQPYFKQPLMTPDDFWLQFKDQVNRNTGCMISYQDFITKFRYHCLDLSRLADRLPSKTEAVSLILNFDRQDVTAGACDMVCMIERLNQVQFDFAASDVTVTIGNITA